MGVIGHVNPNRMELMRLKKRLGLAKRGHKLLKDKQEQLVRMFMAQVKDARDLRESVEERLTKCYKSYMLAEIQTNDKFIEDAIFFSTKKVNAELQTTPIMNLRVPSFKTPDNNFFTGQFNYSFANVSGNLDISFFKFEEVLPDLLKLSQKEKSLNMISQELTSTRRRVSALEHVFIPSLLETIKMINSKLNEMERSALTRLMKVKDIVREH